jgi:transcriptional regulator with XRE-family HTH domain
VVGSDQVQSKDEGGVAVGDLFKVVDDNDNIVTVVTGARAAELLHVSPKRVARAIRVRKLKGAKLGRQWYVDAEHLTEVIEQGGWHSLDIRPGPREWVLGYIQSARKEAEIRLVYPGDVLGFQLRELRLEQHLSQAELSIMSGVSKSQISRLESGQAKARNATTAALLGALNVGLSELYGLTKDRLPKDPERRSEMVALAEELEEMEVFYLRDAFPEAWLRGKRGRKRQMKKRTAKKGRKRG